MHPITKLELPPSDSAEPPAPITTAPNAVLPQTDIPEPDLNPPAPPPPPEPPPVVPPPPPPAATKKLIDVVRG